MSAAAHFIAFLFATPAGILTYIVHIAAANYGLSNALSGLANIIDDADARQTGPQTQATQTGTATGTGTGQTEGERLTPEERQQRLEQMRRDATGIRQTTQPPTRQQQTVGEPDEIRIWHDQ